MVESWRKPRSQSRARARSLACRGRRTPRGQRRHSNGMPRVIHALHAVAIPHGPWGFWKGSARLQLDGHGRNKERAHRVHCDMRLNLPRRSKKGLPDRPRQPFGPATEPNRCWALDFMFQTPNVIDETNRECLAIGLGMSIPSARLIRILSFRDRPPCHQAGQPPPASGSQDQCGQAP